MSVSLIAPIYGLVDLIRRRVGVLEGRLTETRGNLLDALSPTGPTSRRFAVFTESGTWTAPEGVYAISATLVGGGGGAARYGTLYSSGGSGEIVNGYALPVLPGASINVIVGAGGQSYAGLGAAGGGGISEINAGAETQKVQALGGDNGAVEAQGYPSTNVAKTATNKTMWANDRTGLAGKTFLPPYGVSGVANSTTLTSGTSGVVIIEY